MLLNMIYVSDFPSNVARTQRVFAYAPKGESGHVVIIINPHKSNYSYLRDGYVLPSPPSFFFLTNILWGEVGWLGGKFVMVNDIYYDDIHVVVNIIFIWVGMMNGVILVNELF